MICNRTKGRAVNRRHLLDDERVRHVRRRRWI